MEAALVPRLELGQGRCQELIPATEKSGFPQLTRLDSLGRRCVFTSVFAESVMMRDFLTGGMFNICHVATPTWP